ncbi:hypothetical protein C9E81_12655 [Paracoccus alkanivorans]|uniref:Type III secretion protein n=2 Tax=Paracoccus alkanivorans TaxID=2116655 RepID=A0A3M0MCK3_9RHOB|nr:hypothetical protein C9E81_12655 [Paracoccus alkanivorans]
MAPVFRSIPLCLTILALLVLPVAGQGVLVMQKDILAHPFPYRANDVQIEAVLQEMTQKTDIPVIAAEGVGGRVTISNPDGSLRDALDDMASQGHMVWWFDGVAVHVEPAGTVVSRLIGLDGVPVDELRNQMRELGLSDPHYPLRAGAEAGMIRVVAPQGYIDAVSELVEHMAAASAPDAKSKGLPTIIRGNGWRHGRTQ